MADTREVAGAGHRDSDDVIRGYEQVALAIMAVARDERTELILNVRNRSRCRSWTDAVVEIPCVSTRTAPPGSSTAAGHAAGLVAASRRSSGPSRPRSTAPAAALKALALTRSADARRDSATKAR